MSGEHELPPQPPHDRHWRRKVAEAAKAGDHERVHEILLEIDITYRTGYNMGLAFAEQRIAELERERDEARLIAMSSEHRVNSEALGRAWGVDTLDADGPGGLHELAYAAKQRILKEAPDA